MTAPNVSINRNTQYLGNGNTDGVKMFQNPRSKPTQGIVQGAALASITSYNANVGTLSATAANVCGGQDVTAVGLAANDFVVGVTKPTAQAGIGVAYSAVVTADTANINLCNPTAGSVTATGDETYSITALRGMPTITANCGTVSEMLPKTTREDIFTFTPSGAAATASISAGTVESITMSAAGTGYYAPPTVVITPASTSSGSGATAVAVVAAGTVVSVKVTNGGSGYTVAPTISFIGGNYVTPGMIAAVTKPTHQANLAICGVRVAGNNQIGVTYTVTGAANITPTANESYTFLAFNDIPAVSPVIQITANIANCVAAAANTSNSTAVTAVGIAATDMVLNINAALQTPLVFGGAVAAANTVTFHYGGGVPGGTPANGVYTFPVLKPGLGAPVKVHSVKLTPASVAAITTAEQVFTLPSNITLQANSTVLVNKPSHTPYIGVLGARANSTSTLAITFMNVSSAAIVPPAEEYIIANFPSYPPSLSANQLAGYCSQIVAPTMNDSVNQGNEVQQSLVEAGIVYGS